MMRRDRYAGDAAERQFVERDGAGMHRRSGRADRGRSRTVIGRIDRQTARRSQDRAQEEIKRCSGAPGSVSCSVFAWHRRGARRVIGFVGMRRWRRDGRARAAAPPGLPELPAGCGRADRRRALPRTATGKINHRALAGCPLPRAPHRTCRPTRRGARRYGATHWVGPSARRGFRDAGGVRHRPALTAAAHAVIDARPAPCGDPTSATW